MAVRLDEVVRVSGPQQAQPGQRITMAFGDGTDLGALFDTGNPLLATSVPFEAQIGKIPAPGGELGIITIRTTTATVTITPTRQEIEKLVGYLTALVEQLSGSGLQTASTPRRLIVPGR